MTYCHYVLAEEREAQRDEDITQGHTVRESDGGFPKLRFTPLLPGASSLHTLGPDKRPSDPTCIHIIRIKREPSIT